MEKIDARTLKDGVLHELRRQVIRLHKRGGTPVQIAQVTDLSDTAVKKIIRLYETGGSAGLKPGRRGRRPGDKRSLSEEQELRLQRLICDKRPEQLKMDFALWNRGAVSQLIEQECGISMPVRTVGHYLKRWGFTPQKPRRVYEQRPEAVQQWLNEQYPEIAKRARTEGGEIHWGDETALVNTDVRGRGFAPKGRTPVAYAPGTRQRLSMIARVINKGCARWQIIDGNFNSDRLSKKIEYCCRL